ncbi:MAG: hypothetical protein JWP97_796 [Labilithrix sp.]|nr:hypothetical protein [Labilithrix sp.]
MLGSPRDTWLEVVGSLLRPARPELERCQRARDEHLASRQRLAEQRAHALAACERRIESARHEVLAAADGVVSARMTDLEREWRRLARRDPDAGLMDLWARIAPASWIDRKRWRDGAPSSRLDLAILLASDPRGVERAEQAVAMLRDALAPWGGAPGSRVRWQLAGSRPAIATELLEAPLRAARGVVASHRSAHVVFERAQRLEALVAEAARAVAGARPELADDLAHAAFVDEVWRAARLPGHPSPIAALQALWRTGYAIAASDEAGVTLEVPADTAS